jgi:hypothetical protein
MSSCNLNTSPLTGEDINLSTPFRNRLFPAVILWCFLLPPTVVSPRNDTSFVIASDGEAERSNLKP